MPKFTVMRLQEALNEKGFALKGSNVAVLGVAYKANIDDCRESPSFDIVKILNEYGANVRVYDPFVPAQSTVSSLDDALQGVRAVVIATAHDEFKNIRPDVLVDYGIVAVVDGRNCLDANDMRSVGLIYEGIGRSSPLTV